MKPLSFLLLLSGSLALGVSLGWAQTPPGLVSSAGTTAAAEWTQGFEAAEGYVAGQSLSGSPVTVMGGSATVISGGAAEGEQFLRFIPVESDNALVLNLSPDVSGGSDRTIRFKVRLADSLRDSRLVLSYGATVALRLGGSGVVIEAGTTPPQQVSVSLPENGWLDIGLRESAAAGAWDLLVAEKPVVVGLPLQDGPALFADLLIFADGSLDLDAVRVTTVEGGEAQPANQADAPSSAAILKAVRTARSPDWAAKRGELLSHALARAQAGELAQAETLVEAANGAEPDTAQWHLENAQMLAGMAFAMRDGGLHEPAAALGRLALQPLQQARTLAAEDGPASHRATCEFVAAQINEQLLGDWTEALRLFRKTIEFEPEHLGAQGGEQGITHQRALAAKDRSSTSQGASAGSSPGTSTGTGQGGGQ